MNSDNQAPSVKRATGHRSPAYPSLDLASAVDRARVFYSYEKRSAANVVVAVSHWGYGPLSSGGKQTLAALISYGLMKDEGSSEQRKVSLTDLAFRILLDDRPDSPERELAIKRAALTPRIHQEILAKWPGLEVSDANLRHYLLVERKFNETGARDLVKELRATVSFAGLTAGQEGEVDPGGERDLESLPPLVSSGDGALSLTPPVAAAPLQHRAEVSSPRTGGEFSNVVPAMPVPGALPGAGTKQDTFSFHGSDGLVVFQWPARMTKDEFEDLEAWIGIKLRSIKRSLSQ